MKILLIEFREILAIALRAIRANKMRAILTTLGIIIGIVAIVMRLFKRKIPVRIERDK